jgi:hypothetical protein
MSPEPTPTTPPPQTTPLQATTRSEVDGHRELVERIRTLERLNADLSGQIEHLSGTLFMTDMEKRRLERRYLVVRPVALVRKIVFLYKQRRERKRLG